MEMSNQGVILAISLGAMFILFVVIAQSTGRSLIRFPMKTNRKISPGWFWAGQVFYSLAALLSFALAINDLYHHGYFSKLLD
jgi:hypothetical protein